MSVRPVAGEDALPEVVGLEAVRVGRIARAVVPALVEGQEPRGLALEVRAHPHLVVVHREVHHAAAELEQLLARVAVALVLLDRVLDRLLGQAVLQLEGGDGQAVDEEAQVERELRLVAAVAQLAGDAEAVRGVALRGLGVARRRRAVEQVELVRPVLDAVAQHVDDAALADLALQAGQELAPRRAVLVEVERLGRLGLGGLQEGAELRQVDAVLAVVVLGLAADPAGRRRSPAARARSPALRRVAGRGRSAPCRSGVRGPSRWCRSFMLRPPRGRRRGRRPRPRRLRSASPPRRAAPAPRASSGSRAAASRTSSLPVTTSAIRRVRYSRRRSISR